MMKARQFSRLLVMALMLVGASTSIHAQEYITEIMTIGAENSNDAKKVRDEYTKKGWTVLNNDLNRGARGWYIYIIWKTSSNANPEKGYITDICTSDKVVKSFIFEGRTYYRASNNNGFNGDLNRGAGGADIFVYYTRDRGKLNTYGSDKRVITQLSVTNKAEDGSDFRVCGDVVLENWLFWCEVASGYSLMRLTDHGAERLSDTAFEASLGCGYYEYGEGIEFFEGLHPVKQNGLWGYVDEQAEWVILPQYDSADNFRDGLALVEKDGKLMYIDHSAAVVWEERRS